LSDDLVKPFFGQGALIGGALLSPCWDKSKCLQYTCEFAFASACHETYFTFRVKASLHLPQNITFFVNKNKPRPGEKNWTEKKPNISVQNQSIAQRLIVSC